MKLDTKLDIEPLFDRIIVKRKELEKIGSIFLPKTAQTRKTTDGVVQAVGDEVKFVKPGDWVTWGRYAGAEIEREGEVYYMLREVDLLGKLKNVNSSKKRKKVAA